MLSILLLPLAAVAQEVSLAFPPANSEYAALAGREALAEGGPNRFLFSLESTARFADPVPLASADALAIGADVQDAAPALVPLPPPLWAGLAILGALAFARAKQHRRHSPSHYM